MKLLVDFIWNHNLIRLLLQPNLTVTINKKRHKIQRLFSCVKEGMFSYALTEKKNNIILIV